MITLIKRRKRNSLFPFDSRLMTPWINSLLSSWGSRLFEPNFSSLSRFVDSSLNFYLKQKVVSPHKITLYLF